MARRVPVKFSAEGTPYVDPSVSAIAPEKLEALVHDAFKEKAMSKQVHVITFITDGDERTEEDIEDMHAELAGKNLEHLHGFALTLEPSTPEGELYDTVEPIVRAIFKAQKKLWGKR